MSKCHHTAPGERLPGRQHHRLERGEPQEPHHARRYVEWGGPPACLRFPRLFNPHYIAPRPPPTAAHKDGVTVLGWLGEQDLMSSGNDAVIVLWDLAKAGK